MDNKVNECVVCGLNIPEGDHICTNCKKLVSEPRKEITEETAETVRAAAAQRTAEKEAREPKKTEITFYIKEDTRTRERQLRREHKLRVFSGWAFLAGLCWGLTPYFFHIARLARNSNALGGEIIIPLIPFICFLLHTAENKRTKK